MKTSIRKGRKVIRVYQGPRYSGDILLDGRQRVWRRANTIPPDVVLKALIAWSRRGEVLGEIVSRADGRIYRWQLLSQIHEVQPLLSTMAA